MEQMEFYRVELLLDNWEQQAKKEKELQLAKEKVLDQMMADLKEAEANAK